MSTEPTNVSEHEAIAQVGAVSAPPWFSPAWPAATN